MNLSNLLKEIRGKDSQKDMADKAGVTKQTINKIEVQRIKPGDGVKLSTIRKIADAYKLPRAKRLELITAWLRHVLSDDFYNFEIHPLQANLKDTTDLNQQIMVAIQELDKKEKHAVLLACSDKHVRSALMSITAMANKP